MGFSLEGITRAGALIPAATMTGMLDAVCNPNPHSPFAYKNRVQIDVVGPDGKVKEHHDYVENIMCTFGLNRLCELAATGGEASSWLSAYRIGTATDAAASTQDSLVASTGSVALSGASFDLSDQGDRTMRMLVTFASNNPAGTATINEVGAFCNSTANSQMAVRSVLGTASVNKGASDSINISHDVIFTTA